MRPESRERHQEYGERNLESRYRHQKYMERATQNMGRGILNPGIGIWNMVMATRNMGRGMQNLGRGIRSPWRSRRHIQKQGRGIWNLTHENHLARKSNPKTRYPESKGGNRSSKTLWITWHGVIRDVHCTRAKTLEFNSDLPSTSSYPDNSNNKRTHRYVSEYSIHGSI